MSIGDCWLKDFTMCLEREEEGKERVPLTVKLHLKELKERKIMKIFDEVCAQAAIDYAEELEEELKEHGTAERPHAGGKIVYGAPPVSAEMRRDAQRLAKPALSNLLRFPTAMSGLANLLEYGEKKHGGFLAGKASADYKTIADSLLRHLTAVLNGEEMDKESGKAHRFHLLANAVFFAELLAPQVDILERGDKTSADYSPLQPSCFGKYPPDADNRIRLSACPGCRYAMGCIHKTKERNKDVT